MGYAKHRTLQQFDLWSNADDDRIRWDWSQIARVEVPAYRKHHLHVRKLAHRLENGPVHVFWPFTGTCVVKLRRQMTNWEIKLFWRLCNHCQFRNGCGRVAP